MVVFMFILQDSYYNQYEDFFYSTENCMIVCRYLISSFFLHPEIRVGKKKKKKNTVLKNPLKVKNTNFSLY
jgi:hypothetical protein